MVAGVHLATIHDVRWAKDKNGSLLSKPNGDKALEIIFKDKDGYSINSIFWLSSNTKWCLDSLCKAIGVDNTSRTPDVKEVIGKKLFVAVANEYRMFDGKRQLNDSGEEIYYPKLLMKFFPVTDPNKHPVIEGDPKYNGGECGGMFLIEKQVHE